MNITAEDESLIYCGEDGKYFDVSAAASVLLREEVLRVGCGRSETYTGSGELVAVATLVVPCSDLFAWRTAEFEEVARHEIPGLYDACKADRDWGHIRWCCIHRKQKPQGLVVNMMKESGAWDDVMEALPDSFSDRKMRGCAEEKGRKEATL